MEGNGCGAFNQQKSLKQNGSQSFLPPPRKIQNIGALENMQYTYSERNKPSDRRPENPRNVNSFTQRKIANVYYNVICSSKKNYLWESVDIIR